MHPDIFNILLSAIIFSTGFYGFLHGQLNTFYIQRNNGIDPGFKATLSVVGLESIELPCFF